MPNKLKKICLVVCGGTITMAHDPINGSLVPAYNLSDILARVPELKSIAEIDSAFVCDIDSSNMTPDLWLVLARTIAERINEFDGFVVTHGTDTMAYTASAISFLLQGAGKPIIFTGAQTPIHENTGSDAKNNLIFASRFALEDLGEVAIFFGSDLLRANRTRKFSQFDFDAFKSFNLPPIGKIGIRPKLAEHRINRSKSALNEIPRSLPEVFLLKYFPGLKPSIIESIASSGYKGLVLEGVGAGNLPSVVDFGSQIRKLAERGIPVVVTTQCIVGAAEMFIYEVGKAAEQNGAISAYDMTPEAALTKLSYLLSKSSQIDEIRREMQQSLVGEISLSS